MGIQLEQVRAYCQLELENWAIWSSSVSPRTECGWYKKQPYYNSAGGVSGVVIDEEKAEKLDRVLGVLIRGDSQIKQIVFLKGYSDMSYKAIARSVNNHSSGEKKVDHNYVSKIVNSVFDKLEGYFAVKLDLV